jgi:translation initiation factor IF-3
MSPLQAREVARKRNLDLVEVAPTGEPPVCRLLDYGKFKYEQSKKEREAKKSQHVSMLREVRLRPSIDGHDFNAKARSASKLLNEGNKVKITVLFRGREITHPENGWRLLQRMAESLKEIAAPERQAGLEGKRMSFILVPTPAQKAKVKEAVKETVKET